MSTPEQVDGLRVVPLSPSAVSEMVAALYGGRPARIPSRAEQLEIAQAEVVRWTRKVAELESASDPEPPLAA